MNKQNKLLTMKIVYSIIFITLAFWAIFAYLTLVELVENQKIYAKLINISGKQRMLSQKTTLFVKRHYESNDEKIYKHLNELVDLMKSDHNFMLKNLTTKNIQEIYFNEPYNLDKKVKSFFDLLDKYIHNPDFELVKKIQNYSFELLPQLNYAVYQFENEINKKTEELERREFYILVFGLLTLALEALLIIIPSIRINEKTLQKLHKVNKILAKRVKRELEKVKKRDELINRNSKIITISKLIDNIAHYWRQPLSVISVSASGMLVKKEFGKLDDEELIKSLNEIVKNSSYLSNTIEKYRLMFDSKEDKNSFNFIHLYKTSIGILSNYFKESSIKTYEDINDIKFYGFESDLIQVMVFIYENAKDILSSKDMENRVIFTKVVQKNDHVIISIQDSGGGVDEDTLKNLFTNDLDNKKREISSGMALYISHQIIKNSFNGEIEVSNEEFELEEKKYFGACFKIYLPIKV